MAHGREIFTKRLNEYLELSSSASEILLPASPDTSPEMANPARRLQFSSEHKVEMSPIPYFSSDGKDLASDEEVQTNSAAIQTNSAAIPRLSDTQPPTPPEPDTTPVTETPQKFLSMSDSAKALIDFVTGGITEVVTEENSAEMSMSGPDTEEEFDAVAHESRGERNIERSASFDAAAYIEKACNEMITPSSSPSCDEMSDYTDVEEDQVLGEEDKGTVMSEGAKSLIDSLLVFSEDGMDEIANHIESNRDEDQLAEEEIENFIGNIADHAIGSYAQLLEMNEADDRDNEADDRDQPYQPYS